MGKSLGRERNFDECFELGTEYWQRRVSGNRRELIREPMTEKALLPSDDRTNRMERTSESKDLVETEFVGNGKRL